MFIYKIFFSFNILEVVRERIIWIFNILFRVCVLFFGGKDFGLMLYLIVEFVR